MTDEPAALWAPVPGTSLLAVAAAAPGEAELPAPAEASGPPAPGDVRFAPGALRGIALMHTAGPGPEVSSAAADAAVLVLDRCLDGSLARQDLLDLYEAAAAAGPDAAAAVFRAAQAWAVTAGTAADAALTRLGSWLLRAPDAEAARTGIVLLMALDDLGGQERGVALLGRFAELSFEACAALGSDLGRFEPHLLALARRHDGWGRVHAVLQLARSETPAVRRWLVAEGFRGGITPGYTALAVAVQADLAGQLAAELADGRGPGPEAVPLLDGARDLLLALLDPYGPSGGIGEYPAAGAAVEAWLSACARRGVAALDVEDLSAVVQLLADLDEEGLLGSHDGVPEPTATRARELCRALLSAPAAREVAEAALAHPARPASFPAATRVGRALGLDVLPALSARLRRDPDDTGLWWDLASGTGHRPAEVVELALALLPEDGVPTSTRAALLGQGPHAGLVFVLQQVVSRHPGTGWALVERSLRSPLLGARQQALTALLAWPRTTWPEAATPALQAAAAREADQALRTRLEEALRPPAPAAPATPAAPEPAVADPWDPLPLTARLRGGAPSSWFVKESLTYLAPDGQANVIASCEPLDRSFTAVQYATVQGDLLRREFPGYWEYSLEPAKVFGGRDGLLRRFSWTPPDGVRVEQVQAYYAADGRGWTATATAPATAFGRHEAVLRRIVADLTTSVEVPDQARARLVPVDGDVLRAAWAATGWSVEPISDTSLRARFRGSGAPGDPGFVVIAHVQPGLTSLLTATSDRWSLPQERSHELLVTANDWNTRRAWPAACVRALDGTGDVGLALHHGVPLSGGVTTDQLTEVVAAVVSAAADFHDEVLERLR